MEKVKELILVSGNSEQPVGREGGMHLCFFAHVQCLLQQPVHLAVP